MVVDAIALRTCTVEDADALALVASATFLETYAGMVEGSAIVAHCANRLSAHAFAQLFSQPRCQTWLAETRAGAAPVGYAMLTAPDLPLATLTPQDIELKRIYLLSRFHGTGTGRALLETAATAARHSGHQRLLLGVNRDNTRGLAFYYRNGFVDAGVRTFTVGHQTFDDLVLAKQL